MWWELWPFFFFFFLLDSVSICLLYLFLFAHFIILAAVGLHCGVQAFVVDCELH